MGRFFSSVHIKNNSSKEQFVKSFCNVMKRRDLVMCSENEASISYILAFSGRGKWVTLTSEVYRDNPKQVKDDAQQTAAEMKTSSFSMDVVDSDWAYIELYTGIDIHDTVIVGRSEFPEDDPPKGRRECWEQLSEIWNKNEAFVEDALYEAASMFGIEPKYMVLDYEDFNSTTNEDTNIVPLFFKKKITSAKDGEKKLTLNGAFKQVFGEALEPLGFVKIKNKYPYYVRLIGNDILHIITLRTEWSDDSTIKNFNILAGVATVYRKRLTLNESPYDNKSWLGKISKFYQRTYGTNRDNDYWHSILEFSYRSDNSKELLSSMEKTLELTKKHILPVLDCVKDLNACVDFFKKYIGNICTNNFTLDYQFDKIPPDDEGFLYIKTGGYKLKEKLERILSENSDCSQEFRERTVEIYSFFTNREAQMKAQEELELRKERNTEILRVYGLNV